MIKLKFVEHGIGPEIAYWRFETLAMFELSPPYYKEPVVHLEIRVLIPCRFLLLRRWRTSNVAIIQIETDIQSTISVH